LPRVALPSSPAILVLLLGWPNCPRPSHRDLRPEPEESLSRKHQVGGSTPTVQTPSAASAENQAARLQRSAPDIGRARPGCVERLLLTALLSALLCLAIARPALFILAMIGIRSSCNLLDCEVPAPKTPWPLRAANADQPAQLVADF
jgi:hypothetical protein